MIYCVEPQKEVREIIRFILDAGGFSQQDMDSGQNLKEALNKNIPELILLEVDLPGENFVEILDDVRNSPDLWRIPIILLSRKKNLQKLRIGFEHGADDFVSEKTGAHEFIARIEAILRRSSAWTTE